jgi:hypothetical protein
MSSKELITEAKEVKISEAFKMSKSKIIEEEPEEKSS